MRQIKISFFILILFMLLTGCSRNKVIHLYPFNKSQCITVINKGDYRYIIVGKHDKVPKSGFVKLNTEDIDPVGDALYIFWENKNNKWELINPHAKMVETTLDTSKYRVGVKLPLDSRGIPTSIKFDTSDNGAVFSFEMMKLSPNKGAIVEYQ
jgi:hypothetical protein